MPPLWIRNWRRHTTGETRNARTRSPRLQLRQLEDRSTPSTLQIISLGTTSATLIEDNSYTGDDRGGIAASDSHVFSTGDNQTAAFPLDLSSGAGIGQRFDALVSDVTNQTVYSLGIDSTTPAPHGGGTITHLLVHDSITGALTGASIALSSPITLTNSGNQAGIFAGADQVVVWNPGDGAVSAIDTVTGAVTTLGTVASLTHAYTESWAFWGVAEEFGGDDYLTYTHSNSIDVVRTRVSDGATSTVASFPAGLSDMASFTLAPDLQRWYFHYEGSAGAFGYGSDETIGFADAVIQTFPGQFVHVAPDPRTEPVSSVDVTFDAAIDPATFDYQDLTLTRSGGANLITPAVTVTPVAGNTYRIGNLAGLTVAEGEYRLGIDAAGITDSGGTPLVGIGTERWVTDPHVPSVRAEDPRGSLVYESEITRSLPAATDVQNLQIVLDAGQAFSVVVRPTGTLQAAVTVTDPSGNSIGSATAGAAGTPVLLQSVPAAAAGTYTISVATAGGTTGSFTLEVVLNAAAEDEQYGGPSNDTAGTAQNIDGSFIDIGGGAQRGAVVGNGGLALYAVNRDTGAFQRIEDGVVVSSVLMTVDGNPVSRSLSLAVDPTTGQMYTIAAYSGHSFALVTLDPATGVGTFVGDLNAGGQRFSDLAFDDAGTLYGLTGGQGTDPESLFSIDTGTAVPTLLATLTPGAGSSNNGESLAYNPDDGLLYRFQSGVFESIDPDAGFAETPITTSGVPAPDSAQAMTYLGDGRFLVSSFDTPYLITTAGVISTVPYHFGGDTVQGLTLFGGNRVDVYSFTLAAGQSATLALSGLGSALELLGGGGTALATGTTAANLDQVIPGFEAPIAGTYYARVTRPVGGTYNLVAVRGGDFDTERNDSLATAQPIDPTRPVAGSIDPGTILGADDGDEHLLTIDPATGVATVLASNVGDGYGYTDLAVNPVTGVYYGSQADGEPGLFVIDPWTGAETLVSTPGTIHAMAWSPDGTTLYAVMGSDFGTLDPVSGDFTVIGTPGLGNPAAGGIAFQPGTGILFAAQNGDTGLYTLDLATGAATLVGDTGMRCNSLTFLADGTLLAGGTRNSPQYRGALVRLDPATGAATLVGQTVLGGDQNLTGLAALPADSDYYSFTVTAGQPVSFRTSTPADGSGEFPNAFDSVLELYDATGTLVAADDNGGPDGRNAVLFHIAQLPGTYTVRVSGAHGSAGEYVLEPVVNTAPSFVAGPDQSVTQPAGARTVPGWATAISAGSAWETWQTLTFTVTTDAPDLFTVQPAVDPITGTLTYTPAPGASGVANVTVRLADDGGTADGGADTSAPQTFVITMVNAAEPYAVGTGPGTAGTVRFLDAAGNDVFPAVQPFGPNFTGGVRVASGDVTGDGVADVVAASGPGIPGVVRVLDGATGAVAFEAAPFESSFTGGVYVSAGDFNQDGYADVVMTPDYGGGARVVILDGRTRAVVADFLAFEEEFRGGVTTAVGDLNGDGAPDLVVGAGTGGAPRVAVFDGTTVLSGRPTRLVNDYFAFEPESRVGVHLGVGDMDGDGKAEIVVGPGVGGGPRVVVWNGASLFGAAPVMTASFFTDDPGARGGVHVSLTDVNGDGNPELVSGSGDGAGGKLSAYASADVLAQPAPTPTWGMDPFGDFAGGVFVG